MKNNRRKNKQALIVAPYFASLGGGERYMLSLGSVLENLGYSLHIGWDDKKRINELLDKLGITLSSFSLAPEWKGLYSTRDPLKTYFASTKYDVIFYLSDGSIPFLGGKKNFIHIQVPLKGIAGKNWKTQLKLKRIKRVIVNSQFTKSFTDREFGIDSQVVYPPVKLLASDGRKQNIILSVGRFEHSLKVKKQDVLLEAFIKGEKELTPYKLVLAGSVVKGSKSYLQGLQNKAKGHNIEIITSPGHDTLTSLYKKAKIYWHAAGFAVNEDDNPHLVEHFGITTVEAVSAGCIPLVHPKGGQKEILASDSFYWSNQDELIKKTKDIIDNPASYKKELESIPLKQFSLANFKSSVKELLS